MTYQLRQGNFVDAWQISSSTDMPGWFVGLLMHTTIVRLTEGRISIRGEWAKIGQYVVQVAGQVLIYSEDDFRKYFEALPELRESRKA